MQPLGVALEHRHFQTRGGVPKARRPIPRHSQRQPAGRAKPRLNDPPAMAFQYDQCGPVGRIPYAGLVVVGRGEDPPTVGGEGDVPDLALVATQQATTTAVCAVEEADGAVQGSRRDERSI